MSSSGGHFDSTRGLVPGPAHKPLSHFNSNKTPSDYDILLPLQGSLQKDEHILTFISSVCSLI